MKKLILMSALSLVLANPAMAEGGDGGWFKTADKDANGMLSKAEYDAAKDAKFTMLDTDKDGSLSKEEFKTHKESKKEASEEMPE